MTAHFQDQVYLLKRSAPLYDTVRDLNHTTTFANDRIVAFQTVLKLTTTLFTEAATESPARLAYYFQHTAKDWTFIVQHICHHTLRPTSSANTTDIDFDVSFQERHLGLHLLKSILLLWPPSCQWESPNLLLPRIFTASANARRDRMPRLDIESMQLMIVDVVLAWCCASKTVVCYRPAQPVALVDDEASDNQTTTVNDGGTNYSEHEGPAPEGQQASKTGKNATTVAVDETNLMTMTTELSQLVHQTFLSLSSCCTFLNDPSNMFDPTQLRKQQRNKFQFFKAFEGLNAFGTTLLLRSTAVPQPATR